MGDLYDDAACCPMHGMPFSRDAIAAHTLHAATTGLCVETSRSVGTAERTRACKYLTTIVPDTFNPWTWALVARAIACEDRTLHGIAHTGFWLARRDAHLYLEGAKSAWHVFREELDLNPWLHNQ